MDSMACSGFPMRLPQRGHADSFHVTAGEKRRNTQLFNFEQAVSYMMTGSCNQSPALIDETWASSTRVSPRSLYIIGLRVLSEIRFLNEVVCRPKPHPKKSG